MDPQAGPEPELSRLVAPEPDASNRQALRVLQDPRAVLALQGAAGQLAVARLLADSKPPRPRVADRPHRSPMPLQRLEPDKQQPGGKPAEVTPAREQTAGAPEVVGGLGVGGAPGGGAAAVAGESAATPPPGGGSDGPPGAPDAPPGASAAPRGTPTPPTAPASPEGLPATGGSGSRGGPGTGLAPLDERANARRQAVAAATADRKLQIRSAATAAGETLGATAEQERVRAIRELTDALQQVSVSFETARETINGQRRASLDEVKSAARTRRQRVDEIVRTRKAELVEVGETKARAAIKAGEDEATRMTRESATRAGRAVQVGEEKASQYTSYERANRITSAAREMAAEAADRILVQAQDVAAAVRKDAADLAAKFRKEAKQGADKFDESKTTARTTIDDAEKGAVEGINQAADDAISGLRSQSERLTAELGRARDGVSGQLGQIGPTAAGAMSTQATKAEAALDAQAAQADSAIGQFCTDVDEQVPGLPASAAGQVVHEADAHLEASLTDFDSAQSVQVTEAVTAFAGAAGDGTSRISAGVGELLGPLLKSAADFESNAADTTSKTTGTITDLAGKATGGMEKVTTELDKGLDTSVRDSETRWDGELADARRQLAGKVDDALSTQDRELAELGTQISQKAEEIENESWWERALSFLKGVVYGFFEELWELAKALLIVLSVVLALVVIVLLIAVAIALIVGGLEGILAALAFLAFMVEVAKVLLVIAAVVGVLVLVVVVGWRLYQAWVRDDLSDFERGKLVGRVITDILSILIPGRALARLRGWVRLRQLARLVGGEARLARLIAWSGGDLAALERLAGELRSLDEFEILLTRTASLDEFLQLRRLCNDRLALALRMLGRAPANELIPAIAEFGNDVLLLDRLLTELGTLAEARRMLAMAGRDVARLRRWVEFFEGAGPMAAMFQQTGRDAALLDDLVAHTTNRAELTRMLARLGGNAPLLRDLLLLTDDVPQLDRMLAMMTNDGVELRRLLRLAGGRPAASTVDQLMRLARAEGRPARNIERLLNEAGGNPADLLRLLGIARRFAGRQVAPPANVPAPGYGVADLQHFLVGHTYGFFRFNTAGPPGKTFWPSAGPGGDLARVQADLQATCGALGNPGSTAQRIQGGALVGPVVPTPVTVMPPAVAPGAGQIRGPVEIGAFQFGTRGAPPFTVGQFFPRPGGVFEHHSQRLLQAIEQIMAVL